MAGIDGLFFRSTKRANIATQDWLLYFEHQSSDGLRLLTKNANKQEALQSQMDFTGTSYHWNASAIGIEYKTHKFDCESMLYQHGYPGTYILM